MEKVKVTYRDAVQYDGSFESVKKIIRPEYDLFEWAPGECLKVKGSVVEPGNWIAPGLDGDYFQFESGSDVPGYWVVRFTGNTAEVLQSLSDDFSGRVSSTVEGFFLGDERVWFGDFVDADGRVYDVNEVTVLSEEA